jgi:UDP-N-acetylmuramoylalanine--D-glutamate ligase
VQPGEIQGRRFSVLGGARSGRAVAALLSRQGARVFLSDRAAPETMLEAKAVLDLLGVESEFGENSRRVLEADSLVISPGVPSDHPLVREAMRLGKPVFSEIEVAYWFARGPIVAITGTNGKTTTTVLTGRMFEDARYPAVVGGNIGTAFSEIVERMTTETAAILEISSFQLDHIVSFKPKVAVLLNITPDHLDRYGHSFASYREAKCRIFEHQEEGDFLIYNADDPVTRTSVEARVTPGVKLLPFSQTASLAQGAFLYSGRVVVRIGESESEVVEAGEISLRGAHNQMNAMAAILAARAMGISVASIRATLRNFKGVEHRLEVVRELNGVTYVNDSKATNVDSVWYALQSFTEPIILLLGGRDKGNDYTRLHELVRQHVRALIALGESAGKVRQAFEGIVPITTCTSMEEAVRTGQHLAKKGEVVLLSPACASFDWFENYEHRGRVFKELVRNLAG